MADYKFRNLKDGTQFTLHDVEPVQDEADIRMAELLTHLSDAVHGLKARIDSLEHALKPQGVTLERKSPYEQTRA